MSSLAVESPDHGLGISAQFSTLVDLLEWRARFQPDRVAYTFLTDNGTDRISLSWNQLHRKAQLIGQQLTAMGAAGKTVLLLYPSDLEYVAAFFGCLYAGAIAVPAYPPRLNRTMNRLQAIVSDSQASLALSVSFIQQRIEPLCKQTPGLDLATGGLLRTTLLQLGDEEHALLVTMHHIVSDAWSVGIFTRELSALYSAFADEQEPQIPTLPVQYADFARWQQRWLQGDVLAAQIAYWKQHLAGAPALLNFPTDRPRPAVQKFQGESQTLVLDGALAESLRF